MYGVAKVIGQIFSNPPFHILRCVVAFEDRTIPIVLKGKMVGTTLRGSVFTFKGKKSKDKQGREVIEVLRTPVDSMYLKGESLDAFNDWISEEDRKRSELLSMIANADANVNVLNNLWSLVKKDPSKILNNPYLLVDKGMAFLSVDKVAKSIFKEKFNPLSNDRIASASLFSVLQGIQDGNIYLDTNRVFNDVSSLTGSDNPQQIASCIKSMKEEGRLVLDRDGKQNLIYHPSFYRMETEVSDWLKTNRVQKKDKYTDEYIKSFSRYDLTKDQVSAIRLGLENSISIVTGLPGTGKTTILSTLCKILQTEKESLLLVAPTGIASKRVQSLTGLESYTIHRAFGAGIPNDEKKENSDYEGIKKKEDEDQFISPTVDSVDPTKEIWKYHPQNHRTESVVIVDEASMVDLHLLWRILRGVNLNTTRLILVGDVEQLPPVSAGFTLLDMVNSNSISRVHLDKIFRQGEGSDVVNVAHAIHRGEIPMVKGDFNFIEVGSDSEIMSNMLEITSRLNSDGVDFHVISPTHHGEVGVTNLNKSLRVVLNPSHGLRSVKIGRDEIRVGDKVMITKNDYDLGVFNGDLGLINAIHSKTIEIIIKGSKNQLLEIPISTVGKLLRLAYATTVHKSQGQEYDVIVMPMSRNHSSKLLKRSLVYTAITRAKKEVYLVGSKSSFISSIMNQNNDSKNSLLENRLKK